MMLQERAQKLTDYLVADPERAQKLFEMDPEEALKVINGAGNDFTVEELEEYCDAFKNAVQTMKDTTDDSQLDESELENVSGGIVLTTTMVIGLVGCFAAGTAIGIAFGAKW
jgi:lactobin A/cerein 7B family class IIb bacteriocin